MGEDQDRSLRLWLAATAGRFVTGDTEIISRDDWNQIRSPSFPILSRNEIVLARRSGDPEIMIESALKDFAGGPLKWCVSPFCRPDDLGQRLLQHGFQRWQARLMECSTDRIVDASLEKIEEVNSGTLADYSECFCEGWSIPEKDQSRVFADLRWSFETGRFRYFLARDHGVAVATAGVVVTDGLAYLMGAQVRESARGQGFYRALIRARLESLKEMGIERACTQAREASSAPILESLGFETLFGFYCYAKDFISRVTTEK